MPALSHNEKKHPPPSRESWAQEAVVNGLSKHMTQAKLYSHLVTDFSVSIMSQSYLSVLAVSFTGIRKSGSQKRMLVLSKKS